MITEQRNPPTKQELNFRRKVNLLINDLKTHKNLSFSEEETTKLHASETQLECSTLSFSDRNGLAQAQPSIFWNFAQISLFSDQKNFSSKQKSRIKSKNFTPWKNLKKLKKPKRKFSSKTKPKAILSENNFWNSPSLLRQIESHFYLTKPKDLDSKEFVLKAVATFDFEKCLKYFTDNPTLSKRLRQFKDYIWRPLRNEERKAKAAGRYRACQVEGFYLKTNLLRMRKDYSGLFFKRAPLEDTDFVGFIGDRLRKLAFLVAFDYQDIKQEELKVVEMKSEEYYCSSEEEPLGKRAAARSCKGKSFTKKGGFRPVKKLKVVANGKVKCDGLGDFDQWFRQKIKSLKCDGSGFRD